MGQAHPTSKGGTIAIISAEELDRVLMEAFVIGNQARLKLVRGLWGMHESKQFIPLGFPSVCAYAEERFGIQKSETYEWIRVGERLDDLPQLERAYLDGKLGWFAVKQLTRVATSDTEAIWIEFARRKRCRCIKAEVEDAILKGRDLPRDERYGLPNLKVQFRVEFSTDEHEVVSSALKKLAEEMSVRSDGQRVATKDVLLHMAELILNTDASNLPQGREARESPSRTVLLHRCPQCRRSGISTSDGLTEIDPEIVDRSLGGATIERVLPEAETPSTSDEVGAESEASGRPIDPPTPPALRRKVLLRDGLRCSNPWCDRPADHAHHIRFRSEGGATVFWNETAVCTTCHALIHSGLLYVEGEPATGLCWKPRNPRPDFDSREERKQLDATVIHILRTTADSVRTETGRPAGWIIPLEPLRMGALVRWLKAYGYEASEADQRIRQAVAELMAENVELKDGFIIERARQTPPDAARTDDRLLGPLRVNS